MRTLTAYYDLAVNPTSYDIVSFLMFAEHQRISGGYDDIVIETLPGAEEGFRPSFWPKTTFERQGMMDKVVLPMCSMLPSVTRVVVNHKRPPLPANDSVGWYAYMADTAKFVDAYRVGVRPLLRGYPVTVDPKLITMTLREADHWPTRNSRVEEWRLAARYLRGAGYKVVVVRDTLRADSALLECDIHPRAPHDLMMRGLLYASAGLNLFVNNGPAWFCFALDAPAIVMRPITETACFAHSEEAWKGFGLKVGGQYPNAPGHQWLVWKDDYCGSIIEAVHQFMYTRKVEDECFRKKCSTAT